MLALLFGSIPPKSPLRGVISAVRIVDHG